MSQIEAAVAEYSRTILDLQLRLANAAGQICALNEQIEAKSKEIEELKKPKDAPKLEAVRIRRKGVSWMDRTDDSRMQP